MIRALELATLGKGRVSPNPMVGCVIVKDGEIIGEGYHEKFGEDHAEINAARMVGDPGNLQGAQVYVTLEPCSHEGKTPPCTDFLINNNVGEVIACNRDPNPKVNGTGLKRPQQAGVKVMDGILADIGEEVNKRFFVNHRHNRPYIILKWAETKDGFIARKNYSSKWISNKFSRKIVHKWRSEEDAILVGATTIIFDNPRLTTRDWDGQDPIRILIDPTLRAVKEPNDLNIFDGSVLTYCYNLMAERSQSNVKFIQIPEGTAFIPYMLSDLLTKDIGSILVEGGANTIQNFIDANLFDEIRIFSSPHTFEEGIEAPSFPDSNLKTMQKEDIQGDLLSIYTRKNN